SGLESDVVDSLVLADEPAIYPAVLPMHVIMGVKQAAEKRRSTTNVVLDLDEDFLAPATRLLCERCCLALAVFSHYFLPLIRLQIAGSAAAMAAEPLTGLWLLRTASGVVTTFAGRELTGIDDRVGFDAP